MASPLPAYSGPAARQSITDAEIPPPIYAVPTRFLIGKAITEAPLVSIQQILGHLTLLHAFAELKNVVDAVATETILGVTLSKEQRWAWFVGCAVERFEVWCHALRSTDVTRVNTEIIMPPLDVIMVWHAYMLNPRWFKEDSMRRAACGNLRLLDRKFTKCLNGKFSILLHQPPSQRRIDFWRSKTSLHFDYSVDGVNAIKRKYINPAGTGYLQGSFSVNCPNSHRHNTITKQTLAVRKLACDLAGPPALGLSGSVFTSSAIDKTRADAMKANVLKKAVAYGNFRKYQVGSSQYMDRLSTAIVKAARFSMDSLRNLMGEPTQLHSRIMTAYFNEKVYSIDLVGAVLRQESFVRKMYNLGWTRSGYFDAEIDALALQHALARYHAFLDLMSSSPLSFFVPTLDIDLVWHTHQLMPSRYRQDCENYVGRFIDHDDKVEGLRLSSAFDITCRSWKSRFHVDYTHCGCPVPGDSIGTRLSRIVGAYKPPPSYLVPYDRPDLLSATHPSDHNAVLFLASNEQDHKRIAKRYEKLKQEKEKQAQKAARQALKLEAEGRGSGLHHPHAYSIGGYDDRNVSPYFYGAFLLAVPMYFSVGGIGSCVAADGYIQPLSGGCGGCGPGGCGCASSSACGDGDSGGGGGASSSACRGGDTSGGAGAGSSSACGGGDSGGGGGGCGGCGGCGGG